MNPIQIKDIKKGDVFYEGNFLCRHKLVALEDGHFKSTIDIMGKTYDQYEVEVVSEIYYKFKILVSEGLDHYNEKYYK